MPTDDKLDRLRLVLLSSLLFTTVVACGDDDGDDEPPAPTGFFDVVTHKVAESGCSPLVDVISNQCPACVITSSMFRVATTEALGGRSLALFRCDLEGVCEDGANYTSVFNIRNGETWSAEVTSASFGQGQDGGICIVQRRFRELSPAPQVADALVISSRSWEDIYDLDDDEECFAFADEPPDDLECVRDEIVEARRHQE